MKTLTKRPQAGQSLIIMLATAFFALSAVVLLISSSLQLFLNIRTQQETIANRQQLIAQDARSQVSGFIQEKFSVLETAVRLIDPTTASSVVQKQILDSLLGLEPAFRQLILLDAQDQELVKTSRISLSASEQFADRLKGDVLVQLQLRQNYISPVYIDEVTFEPMVITAVPVPNVFGDFQGTLVVEVNLKFMWDLVDRLKVGETGLAYVVNRQGDLIAFRETDRVLKGENVRYLRAVSEFIQNPTTVRKTGLSTYQGITGVTVVGTYVPLETPDWAVVTEVPWQEAYSEVIWQAGLSVGITLAMAVLAGLLGVFMARRLAVPLVNLTGTATRIAGGEMELQAVVAGPSEVASLAAAFNSMTQQLRSLISSLEQRVAERTMTLETRSRYLQTSAEVGRAASSILETDSLVRQAVELIRERFTLYYVGLFLTDESGEWAALRAGTGEAGQKMLARGHRLQIGGGSMIGWSIANAQPRIAQVATQDAVRLATVELPDTRSEAALPLRVRGKAVGALTVQSDRPDAFDEATLAVLQVMADQVAIAIENSRLFADAQAALEAARRAYGELSGRAWSELLRVGQMAGYRYEKRAVIPAEGEWRPEMLRAVQSGQTVVDNKDEAVLAVPLKVRDQVIGVVNLRRTSPGKVWTEEENTLVESLAEQLGLALESARLYQDTQRSAVQERLVGQVTSRMRQTLDIEEMLRTAAGEMRQALDLDDLIIRLTPPETGQDGDGIYG